MKTAVSMLGTAARATRSLGAILIDGGQLTPEDAERILLYQKEHNLRFGEAAVRLGPDQRSRHPVRVIAPVRLRLPAHEAGRAAAAQRRARRRLPALQLAGRAAARHPQPAHAALVRPVRGTSGADDRRRGARRRAQLPRRQPRHRLLAARRAHLARRRRSARAAPALSLPSREPGRLLDAAGRPLARGGDRPHSRPGRTLGAARRPDAAESARAPEPAQFRRVHDPGQGRPTTSSSSTRPRSAAAKTPR